MDKLKEMFERLPKWAKIGLPIVAAVLIIYVIYKNKGTTSGTLQEATVGTADTGSGSSSGSAPSDTGSGLPSTIEIIIPGPVTPVTTVTPGVTTTTPSPKHNPQAASPKEIALANHWAAQTAKDARKFGVKNPGTVKATANMTEAQATAAAARNKGTAEGLAAKAHYHAPAKVTTKSRTVAVSHVASKGSNKESPKKGTPASVKELKK
jgi:hypothetical protein